MTVFRCRWQPVKITLPCAAAVTRVGRQPTLPWNEPNQFRGSCALDPAPASAHRDRAF
jgi:hypothetical protein